MSIHRRADSFRFAFQGLADLVRTQPNARLHLAALALVVLAGWYFGISRHEWLAIVLVSTLVLSLEAVNTALEYLTDLVSPDIHPLAGKAKDAAAAAVLLSAAGAVAVGVVIFGPKVLALLCG